MTHARRRTSPQAMAGAVAAVALAAAGCGSSGGDDPGSGSFTHRSGKAIVRAAFADTLGVKVMRIRGTVHQDGKDLKVDVHTDPAGRCAGTISQGKGTARIVVTTQAAYIKGDDAFWQDAAGANAKQFLAVLGTRWLKSKPDPQISGLCGLGHGMVVEMNKSVSDPHGTPQVGDVRKVDGFDVVEVNDGGDHPGASMLISVDSPHYIRRVVSRTGPDQGVLTLSDFGRKAPIKVPAGRDVFETD